MIAHLGRISSTTSRAGQNSLTFPLHAGDCMVVLVQLVPISWQTYEESDGMIDLLEIYWWYKRYIDLNIFLSIAAQYGGFLK